MIAKKYPKNKKIAYRLKILYAENAHIPKNPYAKKH